MTSSQYYELFGDVVVEVVGSGGRTSDQYSQMLDLFKVSRPDRDPDVVIEETTDDVDPEVVLGNPDDHYGWTGDRFVVRNDDDYMAVEPGWTRMEVTPGFEPFFSIYPVEFEVRKRLVEREKALLHASGVRLGGETTLFPAWRSGGKTNMLLSLLREGADFLADDRLWVGADGSVTGYPLGMTFHTENVESFPEIEIEYEPDSLEDRARHEIHEFIDERFDRSGPLPEKGIAFLNQRYLGDNRRNFVDVRSLYPAAEHVEESTVDRVVFLEAAPNDRTVSADPISVEEAMATVTAICNFEWDGQLREYFHAYDSLVGAGDMVETLDEVIRQERAVFRDLFEDVATYRARVPRETRWTEQGLSDAVVDMVSSLDTGETVETPSTAQNHSDVRSR